MVIGVALNTLVWFSFLIIIAVVVILLVIIIKMVRRNRGLVFRYHRKRDVPGNQPFYWPALADGLEPVKCSYCSGSVQWLHPDNGWGKIPKHMLYRRWNTDEQDFDCGEPIHTNLRSCPHCGGFGLIYRDKQQQTDREAT